MKKRILSLTLALVMALAFVPPLEAVALESDDAYWEFEFLSGNDGVITGLGIGYSGGPAVVIPPTFLYTDAPNPPVTVTVAAIGDGAFLGDTSITSVSIPNTVTSIGDNAFRGCSSLTGVTIPNTVTSIGDGTFSGCASLAGIAIPSTVTSIGESAFFNCASLTNIIIPALVTSIGDNAFSGCSGLETVYFCSSSPPAVGDYAFENVTARAVVSKSNFARYEQSPFFQSLVYPAASLRFPFRLTVGGETWYCEYDDPAKTEISIIGYEAAGTARPSYVTIPSALPPFSASLPLNVAAVTGWPDGYDRSVWVQGDGAFQRNTHISGVTLPADVAFIGHNAFAGCSNLYDVRFPAPDFVWLSPTATSIDRPSVEPGAFAGIKAGARALVKQADFTPYNRDQHFINSIRPLTLTVGLPFGITNYTVLTLDISYSMRDVNDRYARKWTKNDLPVPKPLTNMKDAAIKFCEMLLSVDGDSQIAIVTYNTKVIGQYKFTNNLGTLKATINSLDNRSCRGQTNIYAALAKAGEMLEQVETPVYAPPPFKNVVTFTDGLANKFGGITRQERSKTQSGPYTGADHKTYKFANAAYNKAMELMWQPDLSAPGLPDVPKYFLYSLGTFPKVTRENDLKFAKRVLSDINNAGAYTVVDPSDLPSIFVEVAADILGQFPTVIPHP